MAGPTTTQELELPVERKNGGGGNLPPVGGNGGGDDDKNRRKRQSSANRYYTGMAIGIVAVLMFFMALASAFLVRKGGADWVAVRIPALLWLNTAVLVTSSATLEMARKRLALSDSLGFRKFWLVTTLLGVTFLVGQVVAWRVLVHQGIYLASNPASSFFYIFTGAHALHLVGGVAALFYVVNRDFSHAQVTQSVAAEVTSFYWHFMDALWLFLLALLYLGR
jgi:cytochrome c oxidase subunit 3